MRCNAINMLRQARESLERNKRDPMASSYAFSLEELGRHLGEVRDGKATWAEFAEFYCLAERDRAGAGSTDAALEAIGEAQ